MNTTELPAMIRECVDGGAQPVSLGEVKARAVMTERRVRPGRLGVAAAGVAAAGIAGALVASQVPPAGRPSRACFVAASRLLVRWKPVTG